MFEKQAFGPDTVLLSITPPKGTIEYFTPYFDADALEGVGPHITLLYLGEMQESDFRRVEAAVRGTLPDLRPLELSITGAGVFTAGEDGHAQVALINGVGLDLWHLRLKTAVNRLGLLPKAKWGFIPHMTVAYKEMPLARGWEKPFLQGGDHLSWRADEIVLSHGDQDPVVLKVR